MRNFIIFSLSLLMGSCVFAQSGPGGIGSSANIRAWLAASSLGLNNNDSVTTWSDISGNGNDASLVGGFTKPTFKTSQINGQPAINFTGAEVLELSTNITDSAITIFSIHNKSAGASSTPFSTSNHMFIQGSVNLVAIYNNPVQSNTRIAKSENAYSVFTLLSGQAFTGASLVLTNGSSSSTFTRNQGFGLSSTTIGCRNVGSPSYVNLFTGNQAEIIIYNERLINARRNIVAAYLAAKYNLTNIKPLYAFKTTYNKEVFGIGRESDGSHTAADNNTRLTFDNASGLGNGEYFLVGNDQGGFSASTSTPGNVVQRWTQVWRADETGNVGTIDMVFDFNGATLPSSDPNNYVILYETVDGDFSNGGTTTINASSVDIGNLTVTFNGVDLPDGAYFTLAERVGDISSDQDGDWDDPNTWDCTCVPTSENNVTIDHNVDIDANAAADDLTLSSGSLEFTGSDTLSLSGDFGIASTFTKGSGTVAAVSSTFQQTFTNSTGSTLEIHNLYVNSTDPLIADVGNWEIDNNIQISQGGLDVTGTTTFTLTSDASTISQILPSISGAFTGEVTIQRFVSSRNANFANLSSPIEDATMQDLDDDLLLSGLTGGGDGNAVAQGSYNTFYSIYEYDAQNTKHDTVDDVTADMRQGIGYEVYLATTLANYAGGTIDFEGTPAVGDLGVKAPTIFAGWNLVGNPYHAYINYDNLDRTNLASNFYIYNSSNGSYSAFAENNNILIAPSQGFWVDNSGGSRSFLFEESDKSESHSSTFVRRAKPEADKLTLNIREKGSLYNQDFHVQFNSNARATFDEYDARYLPSPHDEVPAITSKATNSDEDLIINSVDNLEMTQVIPLYLQSGLSTTYEVNAKNLEIAYDNYDCIYLKDKEADQLIDLSVDPTYSFEAEEGKFDRFELIISKDYQSCQKAINEGGVVVQDLDRVFNLRNNNNGWWLDFNFNTDLYRQIELKVYNLAGQEVIAPSSFGASGAGTIQLNQLNELQGIYLIQIISDGEFLNKKVQL